MRQTYDWAEIKAEVAALLEKDPLLTYRQLARQLGIPKTTLYDNISIPRESMAAVAKTPQELARRAGINPDDVTTKSFSVSVSENNDGEIRLSSRASFVPAASVLSPVQVTAPVFMVSSPKRSMTPDGNVTLYLPDIHFPFHDEAALEAVLNFVATTKIDRIVLLGDLLDLTEFTDRFLSRPDYVKTTQRAMDICAIFLKRLRTVAGEIPITLLEGNHDFRMTAQLRKYAMALAGLRQVWTGEEISIAYFLGLESMGIEYVPGWPDNFVMVDDVRVLHGDVFSLAPGQSVGKMLEKYGQSTVFGHIHRREYAETSIWSDKLGEYKTIFSYTPGCLCKVDGSVPGSSATNGWRQGIGLMVSSDSDPTFIVDLPYDSASGRFLEWPSHCES